MSVGKKRLVIGAVALGAIAIAIAPAMADSQPFTGPGASAQCAGAPLVATGVPQVDQNFSSVTSPTSFGIGGACFQVPTTATGVSVTVTDDSGQPVDFAVQYQAPDGFSNSTQVDQGCGSGTYAFPADLAQTGYIYVFNNSGGGNCSGADAATSGTIDVTFN